MNLPRIDSDPFSEIADEYDASFTDLPSVAELRKRIHVLVHRYFPSEGAVLDLACGTGQDALILAQGGLHVTGADHSYGMLARASAKTCPLGESRPQFVQADAASLSMFRDSSFDAILSNFGGLNCVPDLRFTLAECRRVLRPDGTMILCLLGAHSIWESAAFMLRGAWRDARRRRSGTPVPVRVGGQTVETRYHSLRAIRQSARNIFGIVTIAGLNVVAPPPASRSFAARLPRLTTHLFAADRLIQSLPILRALGDHTVVVLKRRPLP